MALRRNLAGVGVEDREPYEWDGAYALHRALPMTDGEMDGLER